MGCCWGPGNCHCRLPQQPEAQRKLVQQLLTHLLLWFPQWVVLHLVPASRQQMGLLQLLWAGLQVTLVLLQQVGLLKWWSAGLHWGQCWVAGEETRW